jgi:hypothetical protein
MADHSFDRWMAGGDMLLDHRGFFISDHLNPKPAWPPPSHQFDSPIDASPFAFPPPPKHQSYKENHGQITPPSDLEAVAREDSLPFEQMAETWSIGDEDDNRKDREGRQDSKTSASDVVEVEDKQPAKRRTRTATRNLQPASSTHATIPTRGGEAPIEKEKRPRKRARTTTSTSLESPPPKSIPSADPRANALFKNRVAASKCRQKKKSYIQDLEACAERLASEKREHAATIGQYKNIILSLKMHLLEHAHCGDKTIEQFLLSMGTAAVGGWGAQMPQQDMVPVQEAAEAMERPGDGAGRDAEVEAERDRSFQQQMRELLQQPVPENYNTNSDVKTEDGLYPPIHDGPGLERGMSMFDDVDNDMVDPFGNEEDDQTPA